MPLGWAVFRNYVGHAKEIGGDVADYPRFFLMPDSCHVESNSDGTNVIRLGDPSDHIDHEVELVIRLGDDLHGFAGGHESVHAGGRDADSLLSPGHLHPMELRSVEKLAEAVLDLLAHAARAIVPDGALEP